MIFSSTGKFVFFHNPKAAGSSVHYALHHHHDNAIPASGRGPNGRYLSHYGIDELAVECPEQWELIKDCQFFALYRNAEQRFYSSFAQYSVTEGEIDTRFATAETTRAFLMKLVDRLTRFGSAEAILPHHDLTLFRPQWIYGRSEHHAVAVSAYGVRDIEQMYQAMEARLGAKLSRERVNEREGYDLPAPLAAVMQRGDLVRRMAGLPGAKLAKSLLSNVFGASDTGDKLELSDKDEAAISQFVETFYAQDLAWMDGLAKAPYSAQSMPNQA